MLDRMKQSPHFAFVQTSARFYKYVAENDPEMLEEIRQRVNEGRWNVIGGWWIEPDVNIPSGESLARQGLYGQRTFRELFGRQASAGANPDSFGHPATLPQILKLQGLEEYMFARPDPGVRPLPADIFWWEAPDGTRILGNRLRTGYGSLGPLDDQVRAMLKAQEPVKDLMIWYGAGDHGGGATDESIASIERIMATPGAPKLVYSTPAQYFDKILAMKDTNLPAYEGELQRFAVGCYTAVSQVKKDNRTTELALTTAEKLAAIGSVAWGAAYPGEDFRTAWEKVLFQQFHDSLAGSARSEHYEISHAAFGYAREVADQAGALSLQRLAWQVPTADPASQYLVVFNPHPWSTQLEVEYDLDWPLSTPSRLTDERETKVAHQWVQASEIVGDSRNKLVFQAPLPAFGYRQFRVSKADAKEAIASPVSASRQALENEHLRVSLSPDGTIGIFDKDTEEELFQDPMKGARAVVLSDPSDTWTMIGNIYSYPNEIGAFAHAQIQVLEEGPFRGRVRTRTIYGSSALEIDWILYAGSRLLEARCTLDWHEQLKMLKLSFPVQVANPRATYEIAFGQIERPTDGLENPGHRWIDLTGRRGGQDYGLTVINDAKYGYSVHNNDMRLSIVRSPVFSNYPPSLIKPDGAYLWQDQGMQSLRFWLAPHAGSWQQAGVVRLTEELTSPVLVQYQGIHGGSRPLSGSFLSVDARNIIVTAIKRADEGSDDIILRCYETEGQTTNTSIDLAFINRQWKGSFRPFEIKTLRIPLKDGPIHEVNLLEE
jgi:alpha-mannosidase